MTAPRYRNTMMRSERNWQHRQTHNENPQVVRGCCSPSADSKKWSGFFAVCGIIGQRKITAKMAVIFLEMVDPKGFEPRPLGCEPNALPAEL